MSRADSAICRSFNCFSTRLQGGFAGTLFFYLTPIIALFAADATGLWRLPGELFGMYGTEDGMWAAWNLRGIFEWSRPFDLSPFNPLSGMGSTFLPNTPWLNPGALVLALPLPREVCYLISYFVYFVELGLSLILLFRVIGLVPLEAVFCAQLYLLLLFPPTTGFFSYLNFPWYALAPVYAHLAAIWNVLLVLILVTGRHEFWTNVLYGACVLFLIFCGIFSAPILFLTYSPVYALAGAALILGRKLEMKELRWKLAVITSSSVLLWFVGFKDYLLGTSLISGRAIHYPAAFAAGSDLLTWNYWRDAWEKFAICSNQRYFFLCRPQWSIFVIAGSLLGAVLHIVQRSKLRSLAVGMLFYFTVVGVWEFATSIGLFGSAHVFNSLYLIWGVFPFAILFLGLLILRVFEFIGRPLFSLLSSLLFKVAAISRASALTTPLLILVIPALAWVTWDLQARVLPTPPAHHRVIPILGHSGVRQAKIGEITRYLIDHARMVPGASFRGYVATYLVDPQGPFQLQMQKAYKENFNVQLSKLELYIVARNFFDRHYQNRLQETDLWEHNIPTLEEYGQWVTKNAYLALEMLLNPRGESNSDEMKFPSGVFLHLYDLNLDLLPVLGVRYLITDLQLYAPEVTLRATQSAAGAPPIFLYEIANSNLGSWSPTETVIARDFGEAMALLRNRMIDPSKTAVVFERVDGPLGPARNVTFQFVRGGFHVTADASGAAAIILPVQYSKCWRRLVPASNALGVELRRVNGFQILVKFNGHVDARFQFSFGLFGNSGCRLRDVADLERLTTDRK